MKKILLSVLILTYNSSRFIRKCLASVDENTKKVSSEVIVFDNNSKDDTIRKVENYSKKIRIIKNKRNIGFSAGINKGLGYCRGELILLLNPDAFLVGDAIDRLVAFLKKNKDVSIVGGKVYKIKGKEIQKTFVRRPTWLTALFEFTNLKKIFPKNRFSSSFFYSNKIPLGPLEVDAVSGSFMCLKRSIFKKVGYFDENFFLYLEDLDFCLRAKNKGYKIIYLPQAEAVHRGGGSSPNQYKIDEQAWRQSRKYFFKKHLGFISGKIISWIFSLEDLILDLRHRLIKHKKP